MTCWTKEELENMLEDVVNELNLSDEMIEVHGPLGTPPAMLVRFVLEQKDKQIALLKAEFVDITHEEILRLRKERIELLKQLANKSQVCRNSCTCYSEHIIERFEPFNH